MSRNTEPTAAPERQEPKSARATETPAAGPQQDRKETAKPGQQQDRKETAKPGQQSEEKETGRRDLKSEVGETPESTRSPERADETGKQKFGQRDPR